MSVLPLRYELLHTRLDRFTRTLHGVESGQVIAVHHARVASRRLRELLPVLQLDQRLCEKLSSRLRRVTRRLGRIRELDVMLGLLNDLKRENRYGTAALDLLISDVTAERDKRLDRTPHKRLAAEFGRVVRKLEKVQRALQAATADLPNDRAWRWALEARAAHRAAALDRAMSKAGALYLSDRLHAVRLSVKKLRYAYELVVEASRVTDAADLRALKRTQQLLGHLHDLDVLVARTRRVQGGLGPADAQAGRELDALIIGLDRTCRRAHARYVRDRRVISAISHRLIARSVSPSKAATLRRAG